MDCDYFITSKDIVSGMISLSMKKIVSLHYLQIIAVCSLLFAPESSGREELKLFTFTFENDLFVGEDNGYTNGFGLTFGKGLFDNFSGENLPGWQHWLTKDLYISTMPNKTRGVADMFFQRMQTPNNISTAELIENDVPYAGLLAWQGTMYAWDSEISDQFSLYLGVVGPIALGETMQKVVHRTLSADEPLGWDNQIKNELVINIESQRIWKLYRLSAEGLQFDIVGVTGAKAGNLKSATNAGVAFRWGTNLSSSFVTFSLQADRQVNPLALSSENDFYAFVGVQGDYVLNDILINGNTFRDSHSVPLEHWQSQVSAGVVWNISRCGFVFQISSNSSRTTLVDRREKFGSMSITYRY